MSESASCYEFYIDVEGNFRRYFVGPVYSAEGVLRQISIRSEMTDSLDVRKIGINIDRHLFQPSAVPTQETLSRIAIAQAGQNHLFEGDASHAGETLDFAVEPWEGDLTLVNASFHDEIFIDLDLE